MSGRGRPLRFVAGVAAGWVGVRAVLLWPHAEPVPVAPGRAIACPQCSEAANRLDRVVARAPAQAGAQSGEGQSGPGPLLSQGDGESAPARVYRAKLARADGRPMPPLVDPLRVEMALFGLLQFGTSPGLPPAAPSRPQTAPWPGVTATVPHDRWSASGWVVARGGQGLGAAPGASQLGGGQAGLRIAYQLVPRARVAGFARVTTPLAGAGREAALGVEWQPLRAPIRLVAERRFALDGGRGGPGLGIVAGLDRTVPAGFRIEAYGQAGAIRRDRIERYADGAARVARPVIARDGASLALGAGAWGAAQRGAARLDLGPTAIVTLPVARHNFRIALDWRQRVAGDARPGSGLALTLASDF